VLAGVKETNSEPVYEVKSGKAKGKSEVQKPCFKSHIKGLPSPFALCLLPSVRQHR
jgi:hypothetical protein